MVKLVTLSESTLPFKFNIYRTEKDFHSEVLMPARNSFSPSKLVFNKNWEGKKLIIY